MERLLPLSILSLDLKVEDTTVDVDVTDKWVPTGDSISFRIETNLISISERPGVDQLPSRFMYSHLGGRYLYLPY